jgi:hypothetical protein
MKRSSFHKEGITNGLRIINIQFEFARISKQVPGCIQDAETSSAAISLFERSLVVIFGGRGQSQSVAENPRPSQIPCAIINSQMMG